MKKYIFTHRLLFGMIGLIVASGIATMYVFIVPDEVLKTEGIIQFILRYAHSVCWVLLAVASGLWAMAQPKKIVNFVMYAALVMYIFFIVSLMIVKIA